MKLIAAHISGSEAMFADLCYFPVRYVQVNKRYAVTDLFAEPLYID